MHVELEAVHKFYNRGALKEVHALKNITLAVREGEVVCLKGPSGSGKSTLLAIIGCIFPPTSGKAAIAGKQLARLPDHFLTRHRRNSIGFIFQRFNLIESLSVLDNITLPLLPMGVSPPERKRRAGVLLEKLGIGHRQTFRVDRISGGELQRVAIARALICDPPLLLADEPTAHLDGVLIQNFLEIMAALKAEGKTIILAAHDPAIYSNSLVDRLICIREGRLCREAGN